MYIVQIKNHSDVTRVLITGVGPVSGPFSLFCIAWRSKRWLFHPQDKSGPSFTSSAPIFISQTAKDGQTLKRVPTLRATISIRSTKPAILDWPRSDPGRRSLFSAITFGLCHLAIVFTCAQNRHCSVPPSRSGERLQSRRSQQSHSIHSGRYRDCRTPAPRSRSVKDSITQVHGGTVAKLSVEPVYSLRSSPITF